MICVFVFYDRSLAWQTLLAPQCDFKHVDLFTFNGSNHYVLHRFGKHGITYRISRFKEGTDLLEHITKIPTVSRVLAISVDKRRHYTWFPLMGMSCNEVMRYISGIDIGLTSNPIDLYIKLLRYDNQRNYQILTLWRRPCSAATMKMIQT